MTSTSESKIGRNNPNSRSLKVQSVKLDWYAGAVMEELFAELKTSEKGLDQAEVGKRLSDYGTNEPAKKKKRGLLLQILTKFVNPLVIVLMVIGLSSLLFGEKFSAFLVLLMILMSVVLSIIQETRAGQAAEKLSEMVRATATVIRNGRSREIKMREIVPGDLVDLDAGDMIPADLRIISCKDLFINQASLTGESYPIEKFSSPVHLKAVSSAAEYSNIAFMGSSVVSGTALGLVVKTGLATQFGELTIKLASITVGTSFEKGINSFVWLMIRFMLVLVSIIFMINFLFKGSFMEAFLFSLAVAVGLTPEMLPMIVTINLSKGAMVLSKKKVIVKRLNSIQNLGAMNVLCTDKTGTLTLDKIVLEKHCDVVCHENADVLKLAYLNSAYQTGLKNLLDRAILKYEKLVVKEYRKVDEVPFDFSRRIMSVVVEMEGKHRLISKGAPEEIFKRCTHYELEGEIFEMETLILSDLREEYDKLSSEGFRVLAIAYKDYDAKKDAYSKDDEKEMILKGYLAFLDPPKPTAKKTIERLRKLGIRFIVLTGDNDLVTKKIGADVGLDTAQLLTGESIESMNESQLQEAVKTTTVFARLSPLQKELVIRALQQNHQVVGYLGDGINDAPALKAADVGISVNNAVDIAKESADLILLEKSLLVLQEGVLQGRKTFGNIMKYIRMGSSSNFGNMISMTGASLFLPFLPMQPIQILLNNFLYDLSQVAIPTDEVDKECLEMPKPWAVGEIRNFMLIIGPVSSIFDFITFWVLANCFHYPASWFQTGWFLESLCTQTLVIYVIRTPRIPFFQSSPSWFLVLTSVLVAGTGFAIVYSPVGPLLGFERLPPAFFFSLVGIVGCYLLLTQLVKTWYVKKFGM